MARFANRHFQAGADTATLPAERPWRACMAFVAEPGPAHLESIKGKIAIVGVGESEHSAASGRMLDDMLFAAIDAALADAGLTPAEVDGLMVSGQSHGQMTVERFRAHYEVSHEIWESGAGG